MSIQKLLIELPFFCVNDFQTGEKLLHCFVDLGEITNVTNLSLQLISHCERITIGTITYFLLNVVPKVVI